MVFVVLVGYRIISEKDLYKNKEVCYTYDNNGNILTKNIDGEVTQYRYKEGTDQLVSFGTESIAMTTYGAVLPANAVLRSRNGQISQRG